MAKKKTPPKAESPQAPETVRLQRLDAVGGVIELEAGHAARLLALEASMNVSNYATEPPNAGLTDDSEDLEG